MLRISETDFFKSVVGCLEIVFTMNFPSVVGSVFYNYLHSFRIEEFPGGGPPHSNAMKRGGFFPFRRGRGRFMRGWGAFRGRGAPFDHGGFSEEFPGRRK